MIDLLNSLALRCICCDGYHDRWLILVLGEPEKTTLSLSEILKQAAKAPQDESIPSLPPATQATDRQVSFSYLLPRFKSKTLLIQQYCKCRSLL